MPGPIAPKRPALAALPWLPPLWALLALMAWNATLAAPVQGGQTSPGATSPAPGPLQPREPSRGALLYQTHCVACHDTQRHWRSQRLARDWPGLLAQVRDWQARASLHWSEADVVEVARHLNDTIYRFPRPVAAGAAGLPGRDPATVARTATEAR